MLTLEQNLANWLILKAQDHTCFGNWWFTANDIINDFLGEDKIKEIDLDDLKTYIQEHLCVDEVSITPLERLKSYEDQFIDIFLYPDYCGAYVENDDEELEFVYNLGDGQISLTTEEILHSQYKDGKVYFGAKILELERAEYDLFKQDPKYFREN